jgi:replicative DNA helicase
MASGLKDKIPPHNDEAEQAALGALLLDNTAVDTVISYLRPDDFYSTANRRIFEAILNLHKQGRRRADIITVTAELRLAGELDGAGGAAHVASLTSAVPSSANVDYYAKIVQDCSLRRALLRVSAEINARSFDESAEGRVILEEAQRAIFELSEGRQASGYKKAGEWVTPAIETIEKFYRSKELYTGVPSGFEALDSLTSGFQAAEFIIIGARPSVGKTALALSMASNMSMRNKKIPIAFFTLEMSGLSLILRLISSESGIESGKIRSKQLHPADFQRIMDAASGIYDAPFYIVDMPGMTLMDLRTQARRLREKQQVEILFIDYLGLISSENTRLPRYEQIAEISRSLKGLARELNIPIVALSQLRRDAEGKQPNLADIRESGSIEQDADVVLFLHRDRDSDKKTGDSDPGGVTKTELIIAKNRNGPVGIVDIVFVPRFAKFMDLSRTGS